MRKTRNWSQEKLAFESGQSLNYVSEVELGKCNVGLDTIYKLAHALDTYPAVFFLTALQAQKIEPTRLE